MGPMVGQDTDVLLDDISIRSYMQPQNCFLLLCTNTHLQHLEESIECISLRKVLATPTDTRLHSKALASKAIVTQCKCNFFRKQTTPGTQHFASNYILHAMGGIVNLNLMPPSLSCKSCPQS
jgi:hypothetical protein